MVRNEENSPEIAFEVVGLPLCTCKPRTLPGLFVHPTWGSAFSVECFCCAVTPTHTFDPNLQSYLLWDASTSRLAYALYQKACDNLVPASFGGRVISRSESKLHPSELELMVVAEAVAKFRLWIEATTLPTKACTDGTAVLSWHIRL